MVLVGGSLFTTCASILHTDVTAVALGWVAGIFQVPRVRTPVIERNGGKEGLITVRLQRACKWDAAVVSAGGPLRIELAAFRSHWIILPIRPCGCAIHVG
ncbi:hypothetical protein NDU88_005644 [Pleurodeles waltl]|uniref:Secreted protein n=1 Tax=Pleurodeles waltl TaxID=8319 RepID=A0AAV7MZ15_PLEWA|nr:hypothetical protein NDU88_005644 [Pleurodeles waltl]